MTGYQGSATGALGSDPGAFSGSTVYALNAKVRPSVPNGLWYQLTTAKGVSGSEPSPWGLIVGGTTTDGGGNIWTCEGDFPSIGVVPAITVPSLSGDSLTPQSFALPLEQLADFLAFLQGGGPFVASLPNTSNSNGSGFGSSGTVSASIVGQYKIPSGFYIQTFTLTVPYPGTMSSSTWYFTGAIWAPKTFPTGLDWVSVVADNITDPFSPGPAVVTEMVSMGGNKGSFSLQIFTPSAFSGSSGNWTMYGIAVGH